VNKTPPAPPPQSLALFCMRLGLVSSARVTMALWLRDMVCEFSSEEEEMRGGIFLQYDVFSTM
jgi:hypothetical protein